jgi:hypothetical protein
MREENYEQDFDCDKRHFFYNSLKQSKVDVE